MGPRYVEIGERKGGVSDSEAGTLNIPRTPESKEWVGKHSKT